MALPPSSSGTRLNSAAIRLLASDAVRTTLLRPTTESLVWRTKAWVEGKKGQEEREEERMKMGGARQQQHIGDKGLLLRRSLSLDDVVVTPPLSIGHDDDEEEDCYCSGGDSDDSAKTPSAATTSFAARLARDMHAAGLFAVPPAPLDIFPAEDSPPDDSPPDDSPPDDSPLSSSPLANPPLTSSPVDVSPMDSSTVDDDHADSPDDEAEKKGDEFSLFGGEDKEAALQTVLRSCLDKGLCVKLLEEKEWTRQNEEAEAMMTMAPPNTPNRAQKDGEEAKENAVVTPTELSKGEA